MAFAFQVGEHVDEYHAGIEKYERWTAKWPYAAVPGFMLNRLGITVSVRELGDGFYE